MFNQARSKAGSCGGTSNSSYIDPMMEERLRTQSFIAAAGGLNRGRVYGTGELGRGYQFGDSLTQKTRASSSTSHDAEDISQLKEQVRQSREEIRQSREENERLSRQFETLLNVVLPFLPADARNVFQSQQQPPPQQDDEHQPNGSYEHY